MIPTDFRGVARPLVDAAWPEFARALNVEEAALRAVVEVEGKGACFDDAGRPIMLFEPHVFWRELGKGEKRNRAVRAGLARQKWKRDYPKDSYLRLVQAMAIDETAALRSASWGIGQVMGFNFEAAGFTSVHGMVAAMCDDGVHQVTGMLGYIRKNGLIDEMQRKDWAGFALRYNGEGYRENDYDGKLARAYAKWKRRLAHPSAAAPERAKPPAPPTFADRARIAAVQSRLKELGYAMVGAADGKAGPRTAAAIAAFQKENGLPVTGEITPELIAQLETAQPHQPAPERKEGQPEDSRITKAAKRIIKGVAAGGAAIGGDGAIEVLEKAEAAQGYAERIKALIAPLRELVAEHWRLMLIIAAIWLALEARAALVARIEDHRMGRTP